MVAVATAAAVVVAATERGATILVIPAQAAIQSRPEHGFPPARE